jgi:hypothetical protein
MAFPVYNVSFRRAQKNDVVAVGEIVNESSKGYALAMFKILLFDRYHLMGSGIIKVYDFQPRAIREFETVIEGIDYKLVPSIFRHEVLFEGGY